MVRPLGGHSGSITTTRAIDTDQVAFRGWWIVVWCTVARALTAPGQTIGVSAFVDELIDGLAVSRSAISTAYLVGTIAGAIALPAIGRWVDRAGTRHAMTVVGGAFAIVIVLTATVQNIVMLTFAFVGLRMLGQGSLTLVGSTGVSLWFDRRRGLALAVSGTVAAGLLALAPVTFGRAIDAFGWRWAWVVIGSVVALILVPMARFGMVDRPEDIGQVPDGGGPDAVLAAAEPARFMTVAEALRTPAFWTLGALTALTGLVFTGLIFHNADLLAEQGLSKGQATTIFVPTMASSVILGFLFGTLTDRVSSRILMPIAGVIVATGITMATMAEPGFGAVRYGLAIGAGVGAISALGNALYPKWFGTAHIGAIKGVSLSLGVGASALGPLMFSVANDMAGSYEPVVIGSAIAVLVLALVSAVTPTPT